MLSAALQEAVAKEQATGINTTRVKLLAFATGAAAQAAAAPEAVASLSGDLEVFGLPSLLQSLADSGISGSLTLREPKGEMFGSLALRSGKLSKCQTGRLSGEEAFYQLLERPRPGSFLFVRKDESPNSKMVADVCRTRTAASIGKFCR